VLTEYDDGIARLIAHHLELFRECWLWVLRISLLFGE
jgi:hypothetical protein